MTNFTKEDILKAKATLADLPQKKEIITETEGVKENNSCEEYYSTTQKKQDEENFAKAYCELCKKHEMEIIVDCPSYGFKVEHLSICEIEDFEEDTFIKHSNSDEYIEIEEPEEEHFCHCGHCR